MAIKDFSDDDVRILKMLISDYRNGRLNARPPVKGFRDKVTSSDRASYVCKTAGIPPLTFTGTSTGPSEGDMPGSGTADIFQLTPKGLLLVKQGVTVKNMSTTDISSDDWHYVEKDMFGTWWVLSVDSAAGTAGTGTACSQGFTDRIGVKRFWSSIQESETGGAPSHLLGVQGECLIRVPVYGCAFTGTGTA